MKKFLTAMVLILLSGAFLIACGSGTKEVTESVNDIYSDIKSQVTLEPMYENDGDYIYNYYGIDSTLLEEFVFAEAQDGLKVDTVVLLKVSEDEDVDTVKESLNTVVEQKKNTMNNYIPEQYDIACSAVLESQGNFVYLIISEDVENIKAVVDSYLK